jgi:ATP-dependent DNA helicase RecQ
LGFYPSTGGFLVPDAIQRLKAYLGHTGEVISPDKLPGLPNLDYSVDRFGMAYLPAKELGPDQIVLLRQAVRWSGMEDIRVDRPSEQPEQMDHWLRNAGMAWGPSGYLSAEPFAPSWLQEKSIIIDDRPLKRSIDERFAGEPYLRQNLNFEEWLSPAQKEAAWVVLNSSEGSTCTVVLPTGGGKSSCFWLLPTFTHGLTLVVVPTVALAIDQQQSAADRFKNFAGVNPIFFASDDNPETTVAKLKNKESRLVFASPETCVSGHLRPVLEAFARDGWLQNLVVDEAHLIETWGAQFRVEFQILAATRRKWLESSGNRLRTFLFSATMSPQCRKTLSEMFSQQDSAQEFVCQRLRPEMSYYACRFHNDEERWFCLREAIWQLPRPAIIYMTKPDDAKRMHDRLMDEEGFRRIGCFTGETRRNERKTLLENWKANRIDLMVATSAFGVGVDKADVRTVIHACYPENLDRYYQEVGRSGRDGYNSVCLLMPTEKDREIAKSLGTRMLRDEEKIQQRWEAMYHNRKSVQGEEYVFELPVSVKRLELKGDRTYSQNIIWNKSLLLQLFRGQFIEFLNLELKPPGDSEDEQEEWATVKVKFPPGKPNLGKCLGPVRQKELEHFDIGFSQLEELLSSKHCVSRTLQKLYEVPPNQRVCGGCRFCRQNTREPASCPPLIVPEDKDVSCNPRGKGTIVEGWPDPTQPSQKDDFMDNIEKCLRKHSLQPLQLYCPEEYFEKILTLLEGVFRQYRELYRIDPFAEDTVLKHRADYSPLFLHIGSYSETMLEKTHGFSSNHLFCGVHNPYEPNGRHIKIKYDCDAWLSPDVWLEQQI